MTYSDQSVMLGDSRLGEDFSILASSTKKELWFQRRSNLYYLLNRQQSQSFSPNLSSCLSAGIHSRRLFQKAIEGFELKINGWALGAVLWVKNQWLSSWVTALADQMGKHKQVRGKSLWSQQAHFRKKSCHSCYTDSVQESKQLLYANFGL